MSEAQDLKTRFEILTDFIAESAVQAHEGRIVALDDLDARVNALCEEVRGAPKETILEIQPMMEAMIARLDELAQSLEERRSRVSESGSA